MTITIKWHPFLISRPRISLRLLLPQAHQLQEELVQRRALEYRLRAFTGDDFVPNPRYYRKNR